MYMVLLCFVLLWLHCLSPWVRGWGLGAFLRWWPPSAMWEGPLIFYGHHRGCLNNPIFSNLGLCASCWAHFVCHQKLWPTSLSHPFSSLNRSLGFTEGNITRNYYPYLLNYFSKFCFSRLLLWYSFLSLYFLLTFFWVGCYCSMWLFQSRELVKY